MPHEVVLGAVYTALKTLLAAHAPLAALITVKPAGRGGGPAVYDEGDVPQQVQGQPSVYPAVTVGAGTQIPMHTMGPSGSARFGWNCTVQIKGIAQGSETAVLAVMSEVAKALPDGLTITLAGYASAWVEEFTVQPTIIETSAGVTTRSAPVICRVKCHD